MPAKSVLLAMKSLFPIALLVVLAGCESAPTDEPMGDAAPAFGSTQELSTLQGFAVGKWKESINFGGNEPPNGMIGSLSKSGNAVLTIMSGGKATLKLADRGPCVAHGAWQVGGDQLLCTFTDVDGKTPAQIAVELEQRKKTVDARRRIQRYFEKNSNPNPPGGYGIEEVRDDLWQCCVRLESLTVNRDGKTLIATRLLNAGASESAGPFSGTVVWMRVK